MNKRSSNIELLRIVATFFIVIVHCNGWFLSGVTDGWLSGPAMTNIWRIAVQSVTIIGVNLFILISGYFSIKPKWSSLFNLFTQLAFVYVLCYLADCAVRHEPVTARELTSQLLAFSRDNWFIQGYLMLMLFSPMINAFVEKVPRKTLALYILIYAGIAFYAGCARPKELFMFNGGYSVVSLMLTYLVGRYLRLHGEKQLSVLSTGKIALAYAVSVIIIAVIRVSFRNEEMLLSYCSPFVIVSAVLFFTLFTRMSFHSGFINLVAESCLAVFIFHTAEPVIGFLRETDCNLYFGKPLPVWIAMMAGLILGVFVCAILLDKIRLALVTPAINAIRRREQI